MGKIVRLNAIGSFTDEVMDERQETPSGVYERDALLCYAGEFTAMDGPVTVTQEQLSRITHNHNALISRMKRLATGDIPLRYCPPIQLDHSTSAAHTVGRLVGEVRMGEAELEGKRVPAIFGRMRILGADNIEKAKDGRWTHISVGADFDKGTLNELSITPFPAAAHASMLTAVRASLGEEFEGNHEGIHYDIVDNGINGFSATVAGETITQGHSSRAEAVKACKEKIDAMKDRGDAPINAPAENEAQEPTVTTNLSQGEGEPMEKEKLKKHLMEARKMSAEDADKHLAGCDEAEMKKLSAECEEGEKTRMAAPAPAAEGADQAARLAAKTSFVKLSRDFRKASAEAKTKMSTRLIQERLSKLQAAQKVTPAEIKKLDIPALLSKGQVAVDAVLQSYEERQPVIDARVMGSVQAVNLADLEAKRKEASEFATHLSNMPFTRTALSKGGKVPVRLQEGQTVVHVDATPHTHQDEYETMCRMMDEGRMDEVKKHLKHLYAKMAEQPPQMVPGEGSQMAGEQPAGAVEMSTLAEDVERLHNQFQELVKLARPALGVTEADEAEEN